MVNFDQFGLAVTTNLLLPRYSDSFAVKLHSEKTKPRWLTRGSRPSGASAVLVILLFVPPPQWSEKRSIGRKWPQRRSLPHAADLWLAASSDPDRIADERARPFCPVLCQSSSLRFWDACHRRIHGRIKARKCQFRMNKLAYRIQLRILKKSKYGGQGSARAGSASSEKGFSKHHFNGSRRICFCSRSVVLRFNSSKVASSFRASSV